MLKFYKLINLTTYFYLIIHLLIHFIKIKTNRWIITSLNSIEIKDLTENNINDNFLSFLWVVFFWNLCNIVLNFINRLTNYKIKQYLAKNISKKYYIESLLKVENLEEKHSLHLFENSLILNRIFERLLFTIPKILIYVFYYLYSLFSFSYSILIVTFIFNSISIYIIRKINQLKKEIFTKIHHLEVDIKNEHINFIKNNNNKDKDKDRQNLEHLYDYINKEKNNENKIAHLSNITTELFTDVLLGVIYCMGYKYLLPNNISHLKPIELMYMGINSSNFMNFIIEIIDCYHHHNQDLVQIFKLL